MRHTRLHTHKHSTLLQSSSRILRASLKRQEKKFKHRPRPRPRLPALPIADAVDVDVLSLSSLLRSSSNRTTLSIAATDRGICERDSANSDVEVDNDPISSYSLDEELEAFFDDAVAQPPDNEDTSEEVDKMLSAPPPLPSTPLHLCGSSSSTCTGDTPSPGNRCPDDFSPPSSPLQHGIDPLSPPQVPDRGGDTEEMIAPRIDYMVKPVVPRPEGGITKRLTSDPFNDLTHLALSFGCPEPRGTDNDQNKVRPRDTMVEAMGGVGALLGHRLSGLKVRAPWPELTLPCVPNILKVILDEFPVLQSLQFADLRCTCSDCGKLYIVSFSAQNYQTGVNV